MSHLVVTFAGSQALVPLLGLLVLVAVAATVTDRPRAPLDMVTVALPWLLLPAAVLLTASQVRPVYLPLPRLLPARARPARCVRRGVGNPFCDDDDGAGDGRCHGLAASHPDPGAAGGAGGGAAAVGAGRLVPAGGSARDGGGPGGPGQARRRRALRATEQPGVRPGLSAPFPAAAGCRAGGVTGRRGQPVRGRGDGGGPAGPVRWCGQGVGGQRAPDVPVSAMGGSGACRGCAAEAFLAGAAVGRGRGDADLYHATSGVSAPTLGVLARPVGALSRHTKTPGQCTPLPARCGQGHLRFRGRATVAGHGRRAVTRRRAVTSDGRSRGDGRSQATGGHKATGGHMRRGGRGGLEG